MLGKTKYQKSKPKKASLTAKLDKVFSEYIRLRDTREDGTFTCISCNRILPYDQADCGLVFVAQAKDGKVDAVKAELEAYKESLSANDLYAEFADKVALAKDARIVTNGNYVAIVIAGIANPDYAPIDTALETALNF